MVLAHLYKDDPDVILAFVNYNWRHDTAIDQKIVTDFANKYQLKLEILSLDGQKPPTNLQHWARQVRYQFFAKIYQKYQCQKLLVAHHKDDFLETALMQQQKNPNKLFYGIKAKQELFGMQIERPLIDQYWKSQIYQYAKIHQIEFHEDYTNFENHYQRNQIRNQILKNYDINQKQQLLEQFLLINQTNQDWIKQIETTYFQWAQTDFNLAFINQKELKLQKQLIIKFINNHLKEINLSQSIINNICNYLKAQNFNKRFLLNKNHYLFKKDKKLFCL